ncbi:HlyD family secretion protein [Paroceanicella profunda]|uniref:HlyD family secretion protein n=1 Tax=Paroceanicella profunda TaxID=2579971 RepID=A0A5B8FGL3_9RHOB|nr:HlyD family secretion protein [Paroceanicella profunda]QDL91018.1 HlyD family secretion protein [Paroceanicella profunda]
MSKFLRSTATYIASLIGIAGVALILFAFDLPPFSSSVERTDDAYVRGKVTFISPQLAGYISEVPVQDYQQVKQGDLIARIDDRIFQQKVAQAKASLEAQEAALANSEQSRLSAQAQVDSARAQLESAKQDLDTADAAWKRFQALLDKGVVTKSTADDSRTAFVQARSTEHQAEAALEVAQQDLAAIAVNKQSLQAAVDGARATVSLAEIDLQNTRITAPRDGTLGEVSARVGQYVSAGSQIGSLVPDDVWVVAAFKETQLAGMSVGQPVTFTVDALGDAELHGKIERFAPATGSEFSVLKSDNATGNFTKIAQRLPVRIVIDSGQTLARRLVPGMSVVARIDTASTGSAAAAELPSDTITFAQVPGSPHSAD